MSLRVVPGSGGIGFRSDERKGKSTTEDVENVRIEMRFGDKVHWAGSANLDGFKFLQSITTGVPKVTIPAPQEYVFMGGLTPVNAVAYPDRELLWADLSAAYRQEVAALAAAGCRHIQFDDVVNACLCDPTHVERLRADGGDPDKFMAAYIKCLNQALEGHPDSLTVSMHICRGNRHGHYIAEGGYDRVAEYLFNNLAIDNFFLEYDSPRAGSFEPLRFMPADKSVVLGLVTTKRPELEPKDELKRRIEEAARFMPWEHLALSPQCGFSGDMMSDVMSIDQMKRKLALVVETAHEVWDDA
jgi:5-methyltetrahydropteroyltriglutamate--homocysteine methyltransferase